MRYAIYTRAAFRGARDLLLIVCCAVFLVQSQPEPDEVDSSSRDEAGDVVLTLGTHDYRIAPNVARAIADGLVESAESAESAEGSAAP